MNSKSSETKTILLDTAERLFADHGYEGVAIRTLVEEAQVNLGAVTYHFGSKENLYRETLLRRFSGAVLERLRLLDEAEANADGNPLPLETILECFFGPPLFVTRRHPAFFRLMLRNLSMPPPFIADQICEKMQPVLERFQKALTSSLPDADPQELMNRFRLCGGALLVSAGNLFGPDSVKEEQLNEEELKQSLDQLVAFAAAGLRGVKTVSKKQ